MIGGCIPDFRRRTGNYFLNVPRICRNFKYIRRIEFCQKSALHLRCLKFFEDDKLSFLMVQFYGIHFPFEFFFFFWLCYKQNPKFYFWDCTRYFVQYMKWTYRCEQSVKSTVLIYSQYSICTLHLYKVEPVDNTVQDFCTKCIRSVHPSESITIAAFRGEKGESQLDEKGNVFNTFNIQENI